MCFGADVVDLQAHTAFFLLQEVCGFSLSFTFKGALLPYSDGLENVLEDMLKSRPLVESLKAEVTLRAEDQGAVERLAELSAPPAGFAGGFARWQSLVAAYLFLAGSPMYLDGYMAQRDEDFLHYYARLFDGVEVRQVIEFLQREQLAPTH